MKREYGLIAARLASEITDAWMDDFITDGIQTNLAFNGISVLAVRLVERAKFLRIPKSKLREMGTWEFIELGGYENATSAELFGNFGRGAGILLYYIIRNTKERNET